MFTGIVQHAGVVRATRNGAEGARLSIDIGPLSNDLKLGDSIAVSGACLTVSQFEGNIAEFDVIAETLKRTTLGEFRPGRKVNLERAMRLSDGLDGHIVQGHVDAVATVRRMDRRQPCVLELQADADLAALMAPKGSVAIDGVSLTLAEISVDRFSVGLIPTTLAETTLGELSPGDSVNVEADIIGKYVVAFLKRMTGQSSGSGAVTLDKLREAGFI